MKLSMSGFKKNKQDQVLKDLIGTSSELIKDASAFIREIEKGNFGVEISKNLQQNELGTSLLSMKQHLLNLAGEEKKRSWLNTGLATFSDILRNKQSLTLKDLSNDILTNLAKLFV